MRNSTLAIALAVCLGGAFQASAHLIDSPAPLGAVSLSSALGDPAAEEAYLEGLFSPIDLVYLNKYEYPGKNPGGWDNTGALSSSYFTIDPDEGSPDPGDDVLNATITWDLTGSGYELAYVLVKDGKSGGGPNGSHLYSLYGVSDDQVIVGDGQITIIGYDKGISHVSFFGVAASVPDGGASLMLLGAGLGALGLVRRFVKR